MPWKLVGFIISLVLVACFAGFNLGNSCNVSFGFKTFENVPIFFSLIVAFVLGVLVTLPFTVIHRKPKKVAAEEKALKKIKREQTKEAKAADKAKKAAAKEEKTAVREAKRQRKEDELKKKQLAKQSAVPVAKTSVTPVGVNGSMGSSGGQSSGGGDSV